MKKIILLAAFGVAGLVSAKESKQVMNTENCNNQKQTTIAFTRYLVTVKTVCDTLYQTVYDTDFDTPDCLYNEWEMYNREDCGRSSFENPMI